MGTHNVTVYAWDTAGNMGASPTVPFTVAKPEPFPTALVATASGLSVAVVGLGLLVYFKKRKH
jgi:LPXTG-motif cell wall-anchored protein